MPLIVLESLIHSEMPWRNVPTPRVTISEWIRKTMMKKPLTSPTTAPMANEMSSAQPIGTPMLTLSTASDIDDSVIVCAMERSKSFAVSEMMAPSVITHQHCLRAEQGRHRAPGEEGAGLQNAEDREQDDEHADQPVFFGQPAQHADRGPGRGGAAVGGKGWGITGRGHIVHSSIGRPGRNRARQCRTW